MSRYGKTSGSGKSGCESKMGHFKRVEKAFGSIGLRVGSSWVDPYFSHEFFFFLNKENKMHLSSRKSHNKLIDVKCTILNSPLISRMNSVNLINTYLIILKLYKS